MPSFNFSSGTGASLTDKIAAINARQAANKHTAPRSEEEAEEALIAQVSHDDREKKSEKAVNESIKEPVILSRAYVTGDTSEQLALLNKNVTELMAEVKKINKHINSIVKMMKKA